MRRITADGNEAGGRVCIHARHVRDSALAGGWRRGAVAVDGGSVGVGGPASQRGSRAATVPVAAAGLLYWSSEVYGMAERGQGRREGEGAEHERRAGKMGCGRKPEKKTGS